MDFLFLLLLTICCIYVITLFEQLEQKQKYAAWKAADIRKALKEGRKPVPGPPGGEDLTVPSNMSSGEHVGSCTL